VSRRPRDLATGSLPVPPNLEQELRQVTFDSLRPVAFGVGLIFVAFLVFNLIDLPPHAVAPVVAYDAGLILLCAAVWFLMTRGTIGARDVYRVGSGLLVLVSYNVILTQALTGKLFYTHYIGIIVIGAGSLLMSTRWFIGSAAVVLAGWTVCAARLADLSSLTHYSFLLLASCVVAGIVHAARRRSCMRISQLHFRDGLRKSELEQALSLAHEVGRSLDSMVARRTAALQKAESELRSELEERKRLEVQRRELEQHLQHMQKVESLGRLAGGVSHDFNNLLTVISGSLQVVLMDERLPPPLREFLEDAEQATKRAAQVTRQLLAFSRRQVLAPRTIDLRELVLGMSPMFDRFVGKHISRELALDPAAGCVLADPGPIEQVILNLVINACDAMPAGGRLTLRTSRAMVSAEDVARQPRLKPGDYVRIDVGDTGCGIAAELQHVIFEPFYTTKEPARGTGLGLAMVDGIVGQHGGAVLLESQPGTGSTFSVFLPRVAERPSCELPAGVGAEQRLPRGHEVVLVVEDDEAVRKFATGVLRSLGYAVVAAEHGAAALDHLRSPQGAAVRLVLSDVVMPVLDGWQLAETVFRELPFVAVLLCSGHTDDRVPGSRPRDLGISVLPKPYTLEVLAGAVRRALDDPPRVRVPTVSPFTGR
jgi:signal transduction histidine kinase